MQVDKEAVRDLWHGWVDVGTTPVKLTSLLINPLKGVNIRCPGDDDGEGLANTVPVYVGKYGCTASQSATGGFPVLPGDSLFLPMDQLDQIWLVAGEANQKVAWISQ